jgi:hypothetical protein
VFIQGNPDKTRFQAYIDYTKQVFEILDYDVHDVLVVPGTRTRAAKDMMGLSESLHASVTNLI